LIVRAGNAENNKSALLFSMGNRWALDFLPRGFILQLLFLENKAICVARLGIQVPRSVFALGGTEA
jgi:hypothetical protein